MILSKRSQRKGNEPSGTDDSQHQVKKKKKKKVSKKIQESLGIIMTASFRQGASESRKWDMLKNMEKHLREEKRYSFSS